MASMKVEYIFIEKEKHGQKSLRTIIGEIIDEAVLCRDTDKVIMRYGDKDEDVTVYYVLVQGRGSDRVYLKLETEQLGIKKATACLTLLDEALSKSEKQRYYHYIKEYDGVSESYANRLYPKFAKYERLLRKLILNIVTEVYGADWATETVQPAIMREIKQTAQGNTTLSTILENTTLDSLEKYLFEEREVDYREMLNETFWSVDSVQISKEEICEYIARMKPTSLWAEHFSDYGDQQRWEAQIQSVHEVRNKVAHHKLITENEFETTRKQLDRLIHNLEKTIVEIQNKHFTPEAVSDVLVHFSAMASEAAKVATASAQRAIETMRQSMDRMVELINSSINTSGITVILKEMESISRTVKLPGQGGDISEDSDESGP